MRGGRERRSSICEARSLTARVVAGDEGLCWNDATTDWDKCVKEKSVRGGDECSLAQRRGAGEKCSEMQRDAARCSEMQRDAARCGEMRRDTLCERKEMQCKERKLECKEMQQGGRTEHVGGPRFKGFPACPPHQSRRVIAERADVIDGE